MKGGLLSTGKNGQLDMRIILKQLKKEDWLVVLLSAALIIIQVQLDLKIPDYMANVTTLVQTENQDLMKIIAAGGKMILCAFGSLVFAVIVGLFAAKVSAGFSFRLRESIYRKVMHFSNEEINRFSTPSLITRSTNDVTQVQMFIGFGLIVITKAPIMAVMAINKISAKGLEWSLLTAGIIGFISLVLVVIMVFAIPRFKKIQWQTDNLNRVARENLTGLLVVRAHNAEEFQKEKFKEVNSELTRTNMEAYIAMSVLNPGMNLAMNGLTLGIYWIGALMITKIAADSAAAIAERIEIFSNMVVFSAYAMQVIMAFMLVVMVCILFPRAAVSAKRIREVLETECTMKNGTYEGKDSDPTGEVEFRDVSFRYPEAQENAVSHISFQVKKGQTLALIGATGCGKSTIINLIPRLYEATEGEVLVDGRNVKEYTYEALHKKIGFIPQKAFLFSGTIGENIRYGSEDTDEETVWKALGIAQGEAFVKEEEGMLEAPVTQNGSNYSGGQKQRLSIARALAKNPEILIFDDSFSALDYKTDRLLREALKKETAGITNIIVAQRIGTIRDADRILVIEDGKIEGDGTHEELMKTCEVYREIAYSQFSREELEENE